MHIGGLPVWWVQVGDWIPLIKPRVIGFYSKDESRLEETRLISRPTAHLSPGMVLSKSGSEDVFSWNREPGQGYERIRTSDCDDGSTMTTNNLGECLGDNCWALQAHPGSAHQQFPSKQRTSVECHNSWKGVEAVIAGRDTHVNSFFSIRFAKEKFHNSLLSLSSWGIEYCQNAPGQNN